MKKREESDKYKSLGKGDFLRFHRKGKIDVDAAGYDDFSRQALEGVRYQKEDPAAVFSRMEKQLGIDADEARKVSFRKILAAAASLLILVSVSYLAVFQDNQISGEELYQAHFAPLSYVDNDMERGTRNKNTATANSVKEQAIQAYSAEDFETAESLFQLYLQEAGQEDDFARFFYGITLMEQSKLKPAISIFQQTQNNPPTAALARPATYFLALAYIRQSKHDSAWPLLQSLTDQSDRYGRSARDILKDYGL